jgi:hypothetical protein
MTGRALLLLAGLCSLGACSHDDSGPTAGILNVNLSTPNTDDGALLFTVSGGPVDSVAAPDLRLYSARLDPTTLRVIVMGNLGSGGVARIYIADSRLASNYSATVNQVAARGSYTQRDPAAYTLSLSP